MNLTAENTAIVLDSTADFPDAQRALPELARRAALRQLRHRELQGRRRPDGARVLRAPAHVAASCRRRRSRRRATSSPPTRSSARTSASSRSTSPRTSPARSRARAPRPQQLGDGRVRTIDSRVGVGRDRDARARDPAAARARHDRRGGRRARRALPAPSTGCSSPSTRSSSSRAAAASARAKAFAGQLLNVKPILSIRDGEVMPVKRVRGNRKAFQEFVDALETQTRDEPGAARRHRARRRAGADGRAREDGARHAAAGADRDGDDRSAR